MLILRYLGDPRDRRISYGSSCGGCCRDYRLATGREEGPAMALGGRTWVQSNAPLSSVTLLLRPRRTPDQTFRLPFNGCQGKSVADQLFDNIIEVNTTQTVSTREIYVKYLLQAFPKSFSFIIVIYVSVQENLTLLRIAQLRCPSVF